MTSRHPEYIPQLDGLRGLACLAVLLAHTTAAMHFFILPPELGRYGVQVFFILSGFLITRILLDNRARGVSWFNFFVRRAARIFPLYYASLLLCWLWWHDPNYSWSALYLTNFMDRPAGFAHAWSLAYEEQFYLFWPLLVLFLPPRFVKSVAVALVTAAVAVCAIRFLIPTWDIYDPLEAVLSFDTAMLAAGAFVAFYESRIRAKPAPLLVAVWLATALVWAIPGLAEYWRPLSINHTRLAYYIFHAIAPAAIFLFVLCGPPWLSAVLAHKVLASVGRISYGLYLLHYPVFITFGVYNGNADLSVVALAWATAFFLAAASFLFFEKPIMLTARRWLDTAPRAPISLPKPVVTE